MDNANRFIMKPKFNNLTEQGLNYKDILTYVAIRSYYNTKVKYCYPSYKTLEKVIGLGPKFISHSVKRLEKAGFLEVWRVGKGRVQHCYKFKDVGLYQKIPYELLNENAISAHEKAILLMLREFCDDQLRCTIPISEIASSTGLSYRSIHRQFQALTLKGYLVTCHVEDSATKTFSKVFDFSDKLPWRYKNCSLTVDSKCEFDLNSILNMWDNVKKNLKLSLKETF